jgi:hypothetical protein
MSDQGDGVWQKPGHIPGEPSSDDEPPPSHVCTRHLCGWCLLNVTHKDGKSLKAMYRNKCMELENSLASSPETNRQLHTLNMLVQGCLHDLSSADREELNLVLRIPLASIPAPPSPATNAAWAAASAGPEPASNGAGSAAASSSGAQAAVNNGVVAVLAGEDDATMEEPAAEKPSKGYKPNKYGKWIEDMSPAQWRAHMEEHPMSPLEASQEYRVQFYEGKSWKYMDEATTKLFMSIAALDMRHDDAWAVDANGVRRLYKVWWTGGFDGLQKNMVSMQFRYIRAVPYIPECEQQPAVIEEDPSSSSAPADGWKAADGRSTWTTNWKDKGSNWKKNDSW